MPDQKTGNGTTLVTRPEAPLTRWDPWSEMADIRRRMDDVFGRPFGFDPFIRPFPLAQGSYEPNIDINETDDALMVHAALPGYQQDQIDVQATANTLTITGERTAIFDKKAAKHRDNGVTGSSQFQFSTTLPSEIDPNKVKATFHNGVLELEMPKSENARNKSVKVAIQP